MKNRKIIYIAGYGRSGSTLLERILSSNEYVFGLGEVKYLYNNIDSKNNLCSCGAKIINCKFWQKVLNNLDINNNYNQKYKNQLKYESLSSVIQKYTNIESKNKYLNEIKNLYNNIFEFVPKNTKYVIDSSKTARDAFLRPFVLSKFFDVKVIHLVRDGRGCMWSNLKGSNRKIERGENPKQKFPILKTITGWPLANISPHIYKYKYPDNKYILIKYEDFVDNPEKILKNLGNFLSINLQPQIDMLLNENMVPTGHQLAGNRLRKKEKIILNKDIKWKNNLNIFQRIIFWLFDWPFALKYGYHISNKKGGQ